MTELTSLIVVADDNFTLGNGPNNNGALEESLIILGGPVPGVPDIAVRKFDYSVLLSSHVFHLHPCFIIIVLAQIIGSYLCFYVALPEMKL